MLDTAQTMSQFKSHRIICGLQKMALPINFSYDLEWSKVNGKIISYTSLNVELQDVDVWTFKTLTPWPWHMQSCHS